MHYFRNPEIRKQLIFSFIATAAACAAAIICANTAAVLIALALGAACTGLQIHFAILRYREIERLSESIDRVLHDVQVNEISECREGDLSILRSEIQKLVIRLRQNADQLQADKIRLSDAIADISHQLRTPLTGLNLTATLLRRGDISEERRIQLAREIQKSLERIDWLVESLLKLSRLDAGTAKFECANVSVKNLVDRALAPMQIQAELRNLTFEIQVADESYSGDFSWSVEALGNVLKNCVEHTPESGSIQIAAQETPIFTEICVRIRETALIRATFRTCLSASIAERTRQAEASA